ncbi:MAG: Hpt domain-containing protein [Gammaproteobacteria bacterium]|nr:Hpt domain-containing protein [Gammaproteobacteria bacterium]
MCKEAGADAFLTKPVDAAQLLHYVAELTHIHEHSKFAPGAGAASHTPAFDPEILMELDAIRKRPDSLRDLIRLFRHDAGELLAQLKDDVRRNSIQRFKEDAHALKGSAANVGANGIAATAGLAGSVKPGELAERGPGIIARLEQDFDDFDQAFEEYVTRTLSGSLDK